MHCYTFKIGNAVTGFSLTKQIATEDYDEAVGEARRLCPLFGPSTKLLTITKTDPIMPSDRPRKAASVARVQPKGKTPKRKIPKHNSAKKLKRR